MGFIKLLVISYSLFARTELLELATKQRSTNVNYFLKKNDTSFYVKGGKTLAFSTKYKSTDIIKLKQPGEFRINSFDNENFLILVRKMHHNVHIPIADHKVYLFTAKDRSLEELGEAASATFLNNGKYIALFSRFENSFIVMPFNNRSNTFTIKLTSPSKYFIPEIAMSNSRMIYYTDLNRNKITGIIRIGFQKKKKEVLFKGTNPSTRVELCKQNSKIYILESAPYAGDYTQIYSIDDKLTDISKRELLYTSTSGPAANLICSPNDERLYFIKSFNSISGKTSEVVSVQEKEKKAYIHTDLKFVTNIIEMDGEVLVFYRQKLYTLKNKENAFIIKKEIKDEIED